MDVAIPGDGILDKGLGLVAKRFHRKGGAGLTVAECRSSLFYFLARGIAPGVRHILAVVAPRGEVLSSGGACFIRKFRDEHLGVEWGVCWFQVEST